MPDPSTTPPLPTAAKPTAPSSGTVSMISLGCPRTLVDSELYLGRLKQKGLVSSRLADPDPVPGGKAKRYFRVANAGLDRLAESRSTLMSMWDGLQPMLDKR